jgi:osmotically-inducible protein OsmY
MALRVKSDSEIQEHVLEELDWDPRVEVSDVGVEVDDGVVTLTGSVDDYGKKVAAEHAAFRVQGVRAVANMLAVRPPGSKPNDTDIARAAADAIEANPLVPPSQIHITVDNGRVTMTGEVRWQFERKAALDSVRYLAGVQDVNNHIVIQQMTASTSEIRSGIEGALIRAAEIDADRISVHVDGGRVRLTGSVSSLPEKEAAFEATWRARGVTHVENDIVVRAT